MKRKKSEVRSNSACESDDPKTNSSPVCYSDSPELRPEYRIEPVDKEESSGSESKAGSNISP